MERSATVTVQAVAMMARPGVMPYVVSATCHRILEVTDTVVSRAVHLYPDTDAGGNRSD